MLKLNTKGYRMISNLFLNGPTDAFVIRDAGVRPFEINR